MSRVSVTFRGLDGALGELSAMPGALREVARAAAELTATATRKQAIKLTTQRYNLDAEELDPYVTSNWVGTGGRLDGWASVRLLARPIPIAVFSPAVRMRQVRVMSRSGRTYTRKLPTIWIKRFRAGSAKQLKPFFPLYQRTDGATTDPIRRRVGDTLSRRDRTVGNKLTGPRFYTFPKRFLNEIQSELEAFVGERGQVELRGAFRRWRRDQRVLRGPR